MSVTTQEGCILTGSAARAFIVRFEGHLTQRSMWNMDRVVERYRDAEMPPDVIVDVAHCTYMDSTMLGLLARWAISCADEHHVKPFLVGLTEGDLPRIFRRMSLDRLFRVSEYGSPSAQCTPTGQGAEAEQGVPPSDDRTRTVLLAHETLAELSRDNAEAFAVLIDLLKKEVADGS